MLKLVKYSEKHIPALLENLNNRKISMWLFLPVDPYKEEDARKWLEFCRESEEKKDNFLFAIELESELIGGIGIHKRYEHSCEVGYWISEKHWGKGYAAEALNKITKLAFEELMIERIQAFVFEGNESSERVLEKCGYEYEGYLRKSHKKGNTFYNSKLYAKIK